jgi:hypothetical protein
MYDTEEIKVLLGNSIEEPEVDYDDAEVDSEFGMPVEESALRQFYAVIISDNIGKEDFREEYNTAISHLKRMPLRYQIDFCFSFLKEFEKVYDFEFGFSIDLTNQDDVNEVYWLLEFVEFNHEKFILDIWKYLNPSEMPRNFKTYCNDNKTNILREIEEQLGKRYYPETIAIFLRTYNKDKLIDWFCNRSERMKSLILISRKEK